MKKSEKIIYLITAILILFTCSFYGYLYYSKEKAEYEEYDDYVRGMNSIVFSYNNDIKYDYNLNTLKNAIEEKYDEFYQEHEDIIVEVIAKNLKDFSLQTLFNYFTLFSGYPQTCLKEMEEEVLNLEYKYTRKDRIYSTVKYYRYTYQLDLDYLKKQLEEKKYPLFYM